MAPIPKSLTLMEETDVQADKCDWTALFCNRVQEEALPAITWAATLRLSPNKNMDDNLVSLLMLMK